MVEVAALARVLLPDESEEGQREFAKWKA